MAVILDTTFLIDIDRGEPGAAALLEKLADASEPLLIPAMVAIEYMSGTQEPEATVWQLIAAGEVLELGRVDMIVAAERSREARQQGRFPGWADVLIASQAQVRGDLPIVTRNPKHFAGCKTLTY